MDRGRRASGSNAQKCARAKTLPRPYAEKADGEGKRVAGILFINKCVL